MLRGSNRMLVTVQLEEDFSVSLDIDRADNTIVVRGLMSQVRSGSHRDALAAATSHMESSLPSLTTCSRMFFPLG